MYKVYGIGAIILLITALSACGSSKKNSDSGTTEETGGSAGNSEGASGTTAGSGGSGASTATSKSCGDGKVGPREECDDGDADDTDGCTTLCEYSCHQDTDCKNDPCAGSDVKCDATKHMCTSSGGKADGEKCGDNAACQKGKCVDYACNNGYKESTEECDDGNSDDWDGCSTKCKYSCLSTDKTRNCRNDCDLYATCDDTSHTCKAGKPLPDSALCKSGAGYCLNGHCIESVCGDGKIDPNEECDNGKANTDTIAAGATNGCTTKCTKAVCGNGKIEEKEQCDDGNTTNLDGCDSKCRLELVYRAGAMMPTDGDAPDFCYYSKASGNNKNPDSNGNAFGKLIANMKSMMASMQQAQDGGTAAEVNKMVSAQNMNFLFHLLDVDDPTFTKADPNIKIGESSGMADNTGLQDGGLFPQVTQAQRLDWPIQVWKQSYDENLVPITVSYAEVVLSDAGIPVGDAGVVLPVGTPIVRTTKPATVGYHINARDGGVDGGGPAMPGGDYVMRNIKIRLYVDRARSQIKYPATADWVKVPETSGGFDPNASTKGPGPGAGNASTATGVMCGAIDTKMFSNMPLPSPVQLVNFLPGIDVMSVMCPDQQSSGHQMRGCTNGTDDLKAGNCESVLDILTYGCTGSGIIDFQPVGPPDVDTDGDGTNDSYSMVNKISAQRVTMSKNGFLTSQPMSTPIAEGE